MIIGTAGNQQGPIGPPRTVQLTYAAGPFSALLSLTMIGRRERGHPQDLYAALLVAHPDPDGFGGVEVEAPGYERAKVRLAPLNGAYDVLPAAVLFEIPGCPAVCSLGLVDADGRLHACGTLRGYRIANKPPVRFEFPPHSIRVRRQ